MAAQRYRKLGKIVIIAPIATHRQWIKELKKWKAVDRFHDIDHHQGRFENAIIQGFELHKFSAEEFEALPQYIAVMTPERFEQAFGVGGTYFGATPDLIVSAFVF